MFHRILFIAAFLLVAGVTAVTGADQSAGQRSEEEIGKIVREYLLNNPQVIFEAVERHREKQRQQQAERDQATLRKHRGKLLADAHSFVGGNPDGDVTVVEFFDYRCGYCKRFAPTLEKIKKQDPKLRVVYKEFPILGPDSMKGAQAALAAREQGRYVEFHEALMRVRGNLNEEDHHDRRPFRWSGHGPAQERHAVSDDTQRHPQYPQARRRTGHHRHSRRDRRRRDREGRRSAGATRSNDRRRQGQGLLTGGRFIPSLVWCLTNTLTNLRVLLAVGCVALPRVVRARAGLKPAPTGHRALPTTKMPSHLHNRICETPH